MPSDRQDFHRTVPVRMAVVAATLLGASLYLGYASRAEELPPRESLATLPMQVEDWVGRREPDLPRDILAVLGADDYVIRSYSRVPQGTDAARASGAVLPLSLYIGYHSSQRQGDTLHSPLNCLPGAGWQPVEVGRTTVRVRSAPGADASPIEINRVVIAKGLDRQLVLYWYQSHRRVVASEYWGKVYTVLDSIRYHRTDAALVRVVTALPEGEAAASAEHRAIAFVQSLFPLLRNHLPS